ncbi:hypothetical protein Pint_02807 [Pistacia integerrima]|uniref:Uncharacterized protein n=1 Tax=Pistacia integerrima TaxID=434235 RepID=A0ACC0ZGZ7_9ROSI|nr:hypothetical protein Pint_02807 [Pistacia integerrima]
MDTQSWNNREEAKNSSENDKKVAKEVKGVVDEAASSAGEKQERNDINATSKSVIKEVEQGIVKGLPHQQVPQPGDFSSEALEHL